MKANRRDGGTCLVSFANFDMVCLVLSQLLPPEPFGVEAAYILQCMETVYSSLHKTLINKTLVY